VEKGEGLWLMSFSDMSLILMSFFVLQLSYSQPDKRKYDNLNSSIQQQKEPKKLQAKAPENLKTISQKVRQVILDKHLEDVADVVYDVNGLAVEFRDGMLFKPGSAEPNSASRLQVEQVLQAVARSPGNYKIVFEGHTDDVPVGGRTFSSNWELSAARGIALLKSFRRRGVTEGRMSVQAYAHIKPKVPYTGLKGDDLKVARSKNRRVVIRLE
jgi:chemotaxis protein MotB